MKKLYVLVSIWVFLSFLENDITYAQSDFWEPDSHEIDHMSYSQSRTEKNDDAPSTKKVVRSRIWEFREEPLNVVIINHIEGTQLEHEYVKLIQLRILPCHTVTYVRVEVENLLSTPFVTYNKHTATVIISYNLLQSTLSTYDVIVKGISLPGCGGNMYLHEPPPHFNDADLSTDSFESSQYDYNML